MDINAIKVFEGDFVLCLLNGVADEQEEVRDLATKLLHDHGKRMKEALSVLGELDDDISKNQLMSGMSD